MVRKARDVEAALIAKGMERDEGHHVMFKKSIAGVTTLVTRISHGATEIGDTLGKLMASQCCLQLKEFGELVDCTLSQDDWDSLVAERCVQGRNPFLTR